MKTRLFASLLVVAWSAGGYAQTFDTAKLDLLFDRLLEKNKGMGGVTLARDGEVIYRRSFGYSQITDTEKRPLNADTGYRIGSITKTYTAVMIFQLVEEGRLKLTDTLDKFFPQIPNAGRITIAQILHHRSGLPEIEPDGVFGRQSRTEDEIVARIAQGKPTFEPDTMHRYSNAGYSLLGFVVEKAGGKPYPDALRDRITSKLGLRNTSAGTAKMNPAKNEALSYTYIGNWREAEEIDFSVVAGAGRIVSTTADMVAFIKGLFDLKLVSKESLALMTTMRDGEGMGFEPHSFAGRTCYGHTGGSANSGAWLTYCPEERLALAYATNAKIYPVRDIVTGVFDVYWNRPFQIPSLEAFNVSADVLERYVGNYTIAGTPARMGITRDGQTLFIQPAGQGCVPLEATAETTFQIAPGVTVEFDVAKDQMTIKRPQGDRVFTKEK
ncbi:MAG: serine hydrolase domain-containing protein [Vicinamibacterales bacterium]